MLSDPSRLAEAGPDLFNPAHYGDRARPVDAGGRQAAWFVQGAGWQGVLRRYRRGGMIARISRDAYLWNGEARTRSFREYRLLAAMRAQGLAVPAPLAAAYWRQGPIYRAAIVVERIPGVRPGARLLLHAEGENAVRAVLERIDGIEGQGIAAIDVSPAYWRTLGNRLAARLALPEYPAERHAAWLAGRALP